MTDRNEAGGQGLDEPGQAEIETLALELARKAGRSAMNEYDLAAARESILGKSSETVADAAEDSGDEPGSETRGEKMPA